MLFYTIKENVFYRLFGNISKLISKFHFFSTWRESMFIFLRIFFWKNFQTLHTQIYQRTSLKDFETFLELFYFLCIYFLEDWFQIYISADDICSAFFEYLLNSKTLMKI